MEDPDPEDDDGPDESEVGVAERLLLDIQHHHTGDVSVGLISTQVLRFSFLRKKILGLLYKCYSAIDSSIKLHEANMEQLTAFKNFNPNNL